MRIYLIVAAVIPALLIAGAAVAYSSSDPAGNMLQQAQDVTVDRFVLTGDQISEIASGYENLYASEPVVIVVNGTSVDLDPAEAGIEVDEVALAAQAKSMSSDPGTAADAVRWIIAWQSGDLIDIPIPATVDDAAIARMLEAASLAVIDAPAIDGAVQIVNGKATPQYPSVGKRIDVEAALPLVREQILSLERTPINVPVITAQPLITSEDVDAAVTLAATMVQSDIVLRSGNDEREITFTTDDLKKALRSEIINDPAPAIRVYVDGDAIAQIASRFADDFNTAPINARIVFSRAANNLVVAPSVPGQSLNVDEAVALVLAKATGGPRSGIIPTIDGVKADYSTEDAQALGPFGRVSSFTTRHPCCQNRVTNIQLIARATNGAMVMPGQTFSLNSRVGRRTEAKGYKRAGAIIGGKVVCCDSPVNVGGGTSQFATTLWNAIFFGCYQDVFHQPHSLYFSRYPYVREATLGFPSPDVKFRNDSAAPVYIQTSYSSTSITVTLFGNNGGRKCTSSTSGNTVTRTMTWSSGKVTRQHWAWNYRQPATDDPTPTTQAPTTTNTTSGTAPTTTEGSSPTTTVAAPTTTAAATTTTAAAVTTTAAASTTTVPTTTTTTEG